MQAYPRVYRQIVAAIDRLHLACYNVDQYKREKDKQSEQEAQRNEALIAILKTTFLKRLEGSVAALEASVRRQQQFQQRFLQELRRGRLLTSRGWHRMRALERLALAEKEDDPERPKQKPRK